MQDRSRYDFIGRGPGGNSVVGEEVKLPLKVTWKFKNLFAPHAEIYLAEDNVIVVSATPSKNLSINQKISAIDRSSGEVCWEIVLDNEGGGFGGGMCLYQDLVIVFDSSFRSVVAVKDGHIVWRTEGIAAGNLMRHFEGEIIFGALDGLYFLDPDTGTVVRKIEMDRAHCPSFNEEVIAVQSRDGFYNCYDRKSLELRWSTDFGKLGKRETSVGIKPGLIACRSPLIVNERIYAGSSGRIVAFDLNTGELLWMTKMLGMQEVLYRNGRLYGMADSCFRMFDAETGEILLEKRHPYEGGSGNMPFMAGKILFNNEKRIQAVDIETGEMVWSYADKRKTVGFTGQPIYLDGRLYVADTAGCLYCFGHEG